MILYLDTSSLVKLYLEEVYSDSVQDWVREAEIVATSRVAFPEAMSAIGRRSRNGDVDATGFKQVCKALKEQWKQLAIIDMDEFAAGALAVKHGLRGFDAIHLDAALAVREQADEIFIAFSSFDERLNAAAMAEGFEIFGPESL